MNILNKNMSKNKKRTFNIFKGIKDKKLVKGHIVKKEYGSEFTSFGEVIIDDEPYYVLFHEPEDDNDPDKQYLSICTEKHYDMQVLGLMVIWALTDFEEFISRVPNPEKSVKAVIDYLTVGEKFEDALIIKEKYNKFKLK